MFGFCELENKRPISKFRAQHERLLLLAMTFLDHHQFKHQYDTVGLGPGFIGLPYRIVRWSLLIFQTG